LDKKVHGLPYFTDTQKRNEGVQVKDKNELYETKSLGTGDEGKGETLKTQVAGI